jgi:hemolysin D
VRDLGHRPLRGAAWPSAECFPGRHHAAAPDRSGSGQQTGALNDTSEPKGQERGTPRGSRARMQAEDRLVDLAPGMAVTVAIKTGARRVIEYLLSPLLRYRQESLRER